MSRERKINTEVVVSKDLQIAANEFTKRRESENIQLLILDLDDTICSTHPIFAFYRDFYIKLVSANSGISYETLANEYEEINQKAFATHFVRRDRWQETTRLLTQRYTDNPGLTEASNELLFLLDNIYTTPPQFISEAEESLEALKRSGLTMAINTHGDSDFKTFQYEQLELARFVGNRFHIALADRPKEWSSAFEYFNVDPIKSMVIGDNIKGDVISAYEAGAGQVVWFNNPNGWSHYKKGEVPEYAAEVESYEELLKL